MTTIRLRVNPHCAACAVAFTRVLKKITSSVDTNVPLQMMTVTYDEAKVTPEEIMDKIRSIGYTAELDD